MRTSNPALQPSSFLDAASGSVLARDGQTMTVGGTANKTLLLLVLATITAAFAWSQTITPTGEISSAANIYMIGGAIGGFVLALITIFAKRFAHITAPLYALLEGFFLGAVSAIYNLQFQGIVLQAVMLTFGTLLAMLMLYRSGLIQVTDKFRMGMLAATGGVMLVYLASLALGFFGIQIPMIHESGIVGIGFSLVVVVIAALNLVLDFDFIESAANQGAPKHMEWYGAFGLMVTLVWLYLEFVRLLSKLRD